MLKSAPVSTSASDLRERLVMLFLAALEPVSTTLSWGLRLLADHPVVQDRIVEEVRCVGQQAGGTIADVFTLRYTSMVLDEILRLYPNEWLLTRRAVKEDRLPSGVRIRAGEEVMISPYVVQRDPQFFSQPDRFEPERFAIAPTWPQMAYIPFGAGPRACLGEFYARLLITAALSQITSRWRAESIGPLPTLETANLFSSQPNGGRLMLRFSERNSDRPRQASPRTRPGI